MSKIILIGERCLDIYEYVEVKRINPEAPTPVLNPLKHEIRDGMAGNVYNNLVSLGFNESDIIEFNPSSDIIKRRFVDKKSGYILFRVDENDIIKHHNQFSVDDYNSLANILTRCNDCIVVISDYNKEYIDKYMLQSIFDFCKEKNIPTFMDTKKILDDNWSKNCFCVKINEKEFWNQDTEYVRYFCKNLIYTNGEKGAFWKVKNGNWNSDHYSSNKVEVMDPCGAGDSFLAGLVIKYIETKDLNRSIHFANNVASFSVTKRGTYAVTLDDLKL